MVPSLAAPRRVLLRWLVAALTGVLALAAVTIPAAAAPAHGASVPLPSVSPTPQAMHPYSRAVVLPSAVRLLIGPATDHSALDDLTAVLRDSGVTRIDRVAATASAAGRGTLDIWVGGSAEGNAASGRQLRSSGVAGPAGLTSGGYVLVAGTVQGRLAVVLDGVDGTGTFYAVQTFRQLIQRHGPVAVVPGVQVRDWPSFAMRSGGETFYGNVWSQADALHQMRFLGAHKMNAFLYTPSGDTRTAGANWRTTYPAAELAPLAAVVAEARKQHVDFMYRIDPEAPGAPASGICHSDPADLQALVARYEQLWSIGIHTILAGWDDTSGSFVCPGDTAKFGAAPSPRAAAQTYVVNYVETHFVASHPGARLSTVPGEYWGDGPSAYRTAFAAGIAADTGIFWTGPEVVSPTITRSDLDQASAAYAGRALLIFDNYPVNDYAANQQHLAPLVGRDPKLAGAAGGIMANEMQEEESALIPLFTIADFAWNSTAYDPERSWALSLREFGGRGAAALRVYAANSVDSPLHMGDTSPAQQPISEFLTAYQSGKPIGRPASALTGVLRQAESAPATIRATVGNAAFLDESAPWLDKLRLQAAAGMAAVQALTAQARGDRSGVSTARADMDALVKQAQAIPQVVAPGVYERLTDFVAAETDRFLHSAAPTVSAAAARKLVAADTANTVDFTLTGIAPRNLTATVTAAGPAGWQVVPTVRTVSLRSDNRTVSTVLHVTVTPPSAAVGKSGDVVISVAVAGHGTLTAATAATAAARPTATYPDLVSAGNPAGYWRLNDTGEIDVDSSGSGNTGTDSGAVTHGVAGALHGSTDTAVTLDGGYVDVPNSPSIALHGPFTLEAWFRTTVTGQQQGIVERYDTPSPNGELIRIGADNHLYGYVSGATTSAGVTGGSTVTPDVWHHVVVSCDGSSLDLYLDGLRDGMTATGILPGAGSGDLRLGARGDDTGLRLNGSLDEVAVYPAALPADQVEAHYLAGTTG